MFVGLLIHDITGSNIPVLVIANSSNAYSTSATQLPIKPSLDTYHVPVAHPPANTIPIPNIKAPIIVPIIGNVLSGIDITFNPVKISSPILWTVIATNKA